MRFDPSTAECLVFTSKEGVLSAIAHDLQIRVETVEIQVDPRAWHVEARFDAASLRVVGAVRNGTVDPAALGDADKRTIESAIRRDVLDADRYPQIRFSSDAAEARGDELAVTGKLALHGREREIAVSVVRRDDGVWVAEARLHQPDFGIRPYRAMLGALRVQPGVLVRVTLRPPQAADAAIAAPN